MRVVHLCNLPLFPGHPDYGRMVLHPGRWVLNLALAQRAQAGIDARLVVQVAGAIADHEAEIEGVPVHYVAAPDRFRAATLFWFDRIRLSHAAKKWKPDIVHAHGTEEAYLLAAQATQLPSLVTIQGLIGLINERLKPGLISRYRVTEFTERLALRRSRHAIAKSAYIADELKRRFPNLEVHRIPNTFDPSLLEIPASHRENAIAFVGSLDRRKGVHVLAEALGILEAERGKVRTESPIPASSLKDQGALPILHIFGDRPGSGSPYEEEQKARLSDLLGDRVVFHGTVPGIEVARQVARVQALVAPSLEEMFGNQLIESLLVGTHAIVTDKTAMAENVRRFGNGTIVPQEDPDALAEAISSTLDSRFSTLRSSKDPQLSPSTTTAETARRHIIDYMGPSVVANAHRELYEKIVKER